MAIELPQSMSSLKPKTIAYIAVGGIGLGLLWRYMSNRNSASQVSPTDAGLNSGIPTSGNLGGGTSTDIGDGTVLPDSPAAITFPVMKWVIVIGGKEYLTDGTSIWPMPGSEDTTPDKPSDIYGPTGPFIPDYSADVHTTKPTLGIFRESTPIVDTGRVITVPTRK